MTASPWAWCAGRKEFAMTTQEVLCDAYAAIFGIPSSKDRDGCYYDQAYQSVTIDYAELSGMRNPLPYDDDTDYIEAVTEGGCEGVYIGVFRVREGRDVPDRDRRVRVGTIKTLCEGRDAWRSMGALCGELAYMAGRAAFVLWKAEKAAAERG